jgi:hypothetical protein
MSNNKTLTKKENTTYNKGDPIRCDCNRVVSFIKDGKLYVKCQECKKWIAVLSISKIEKVQ